jgi:uncharacterized membrane protein
MTLLAGSTILAGLLLFFISLPLICRKVPMNSFYGIRTRAACSSRENWYEINAYGGRKFARWSMLVILCGLAGLIVPERHLRIYAGINLIAVLTSLIVPVIMASRWSRQRAGRSNTSIQP